MCQQGRYTFYLIVCLGLAAALGVAGDPIVVGQAGCETAYPFKYDVGFFWATLDGDGEIVWQKSCPSLGIWPELNHFDYSQRTLIFAPGLQPDMVSLGEQFYHEDGVDFLIEPWLRGGWNIGLFLWTQFSDEPVSNFERAEGKIWWGHYFAQMQYTVAVPSDKGPPYDVRVLDAPRNRSVAQILADDYRALMDHYYGTDGPRRMTRPEIRWVGHSLGTQLVLASARALADTPAGGLGDLPDRIALLDPVFSPGRKEYFSMDGGDVCGETVEEVMGCVARTLRLGTGGQTVAIEAYRSSFINHCLDTSNEGSLLLKNVAFELVRMTGWGDAPLGSCFNARLFATAPNKLAKRVSDLVDQVREQHIHIVPYYLQSMFTPPHQCTPATDGSDACVEMDSIALSAATPAVEVLAWIEEDLHAARCWFPALDKPDTLMDFFPGNDWYYIGDCTSVNL